MTESRVCAQGGTDEPEGRNGQPGHLTGRGVLVTGRTRNLRGITRDCSQARATVIWGDIPEGRVWGLVQILSAKRLFVKVQAPYGDDSTSVAAIFGDVIRRYNHCGSFIPLRRVRHYAMAYTRRKPRQDLLQGAAPEGRFDPARPWCIGDIRDQVETAVSLPVMVSLSTTVTGPAGSFPIGAYQTPLLAIFVEPPIALPVPRNLGVSCIRAPLYAHDRTGLKWRATGTGVCRRYG